MATAKEFSIVEYYAENEGYKCGYCKLPNTNYSHGMWAHNLTVQDYQDLIDRGWRRSGRYCYKPTLNITCCPMYTIKCAALDFKLSKSQKKVLKRVNRFLAHGDKKTEKLDDTNDGGIQLSEPDSHNVNDIPHFRQKLLQAASNAEIAKVTSVQALDETEKEVNNADHGNDLKPSSSVAKLSSNNSSMADSQTPKLLKKLPRQGDGANTSLPKCKKAKLLRKERKLKKMSESCEEDLIYTPQPTVKTLEDFLDECLTDTPAHRLEILLVSVLSPEMKGTLDTSWALYVKYQMAIHKDPPDECDMETYFNFLVSSPLEPWQPIDGPPQGYGSFHQQYWLDGKLIAVGVIDILPRCVSSVYFFYDPDYSFLTLGTYGSLREVSFTRSLHHAANSLRYYYMGFYIHSCPKMRYKGSLHPSFLVCPETYTWHPIEYCCSLLEKSKYSRFNENPMATDFNSVTSIGEVRILWHHSAMPYKVYIQRSNQNNDVEEVFQYARLVGNTCAKRMLLVRT